MKILTEASANKIIDKVFKDYTEGLIRMDQLKKRTKKEVVEMTKCIYCGEEEGTEKIANPNLDMNEDIDWASDKSWWMVCATCKEVIKYQRWLSIDLLAEEAQKKLEEIANRTKKPILCATIFKKDDGSLDYTSIEYTGKGDS